MSFFPDGKHGIHTCRATKHCMCSQSSMIYHDLSLSQPIFIYTPMKAYPRPPREHATLHPKARKPQVITGSHHIFKASEGHASCWLAYRANNKPHLCTDTCTDVPSHTPKYCWVTVYQSRHKFLSSRSATVGGPKSHAKCKNKQEWSKKCSRICPQSS